MTARNSHHAVNDAICASSASLASVSCFVNFHFFRALDFRPLAPILPPGSRLTSVLFTSFRMSQRERGEARSCFPRFPRAPGEVELRGPKLQCPRQVRQELNRLLSAEHGHATRGEFVIAEHGGELGQ